MLSLLRGLEFWWFFSSCFSLKKKHFSYTFSNLWDTEYRYLTAKGHYNVCTKEILNPEERPRIEYYIISYEICQTSDSTKSLFELSETFSTEFWLMSLPDIFPIQLHYFTANDKYIITIHFRHAASLCISDGWF